MTTRGTGRSAVARGRITAAIALALLARSCIEVIVATNRQRTQCAITNTGIDTAGVTFLASREVQIAIAAPRDLTRSRARTARVTSGGIFFTRVALLALGQIDNGIATQIVDYAAIRVTNSIFRAVFVAIIALLTRILDTVPALLGRLAVGATLIGDEHASVVQVAVDRIAVIADLSRIDRAIATTADLNTDRLIGGALLALFASNSLLFAEVGLGVEDARYDENARDGERGARERDPPVASYALISRTTHDRSPPQWLTMHDFTLNDLLSAGHPQCR
ncbi:MAG TPA: hypothetical protein VFP84_27775 [Kofleriaceae bacterium]|nr:hypothetical protein [Kofleriaceae bacterium]